MSAGPKALSFLRISKTKRTSSLILATVNNHFIFKGPNCRSNNALPNILVTPYPACFKVPRPCRVGLLNFGIQWENLADMKV